MQDFKIIHLSDLHIHGGSSQTNNNHKHSIPHMKGIQEIVTKESENLDRLIISGDISHYGHEDNLLLAKQWIFNTLEIGNDEQISLGLKENDYHKIKLIPGNHDAWNSVSKSGKTLDRRQKSLANFNYALRRGGKDVIPFPDGYYYDWIEKNGRGIFFVYLDSSYLGDTEIEKENPELTFLDKIAKGKVSKQQSERVLELYDKGMLGRLKDPITNSNINKNIFSKSLKVVVMHHYLFEPMGQKREPLLQVTERENIFRNFALADTDILLCGHKHYAENKDHLYLHHFNKRAKARYIFNYFRRLIGIHSLPFQYNDKIGKRQNKWVSVFISLVSTYLFKKYKSQNDNKDIATDEDFLTEITNILIRSLDNPDEFEKEIKQYIQSYNSSALNDDLLDEKELIDLVNQVKITLTEEQKENLKHLTKELKKVINKLFTRQFLQLMAGSACKSHDGEEKFRSFNVYKISIQEDGYQIKCERYIWNRAISKFNEKPQVHIFEFKDENRPLH